MEFSKYFWAICDRCEGHCKIGNPAFDNGITSSEWAEWDEEARHSYMDGAYDVPCPECKASGKVKVPDVARMSFAEKRELVIQRRDARIDREIAREYEMERMMGA